MSHEDLNINIFLSVYLQITQEHTGKRGKEKMVDYTLLSFSICF